MPLLSSASPYFYFSVTQSIHQLVAQKNGMIKYKKVKLHMQVLIILYFHFLLVLPIKSLFVAFAFNFLSK